MSLAGDNDSYREQRSLLEEINKELGKKISGVKEASKGYSDLTALATKLAQQEENITRYTDKQLKSYKEKADAALAEIQNRADSLDLTKQLTEK